MTQLVQVTDEMVGLLDESLQVLGLSVRTINGLENVDKNPDSQGRVLYITTIRQLLAMTEEDLLARPGFGEKTLDEVRECLAKVGFHTRQKYFPPKQPEVVPPQYEPRISTQLNFQFGKGRQSKRNVSTQQKDRRGSRAVKRQRDRTADHSTRRQNRRDPRG